MVIQTNQSKHGDSNKINQNMVIQTNQSKHGDSNKSIKN